MNLNLSTPDNNAQFAHVGVGASLVFVLALLWLPIWAAALIVAVFTFSKEAIEYKWGVWELPTPWRDSLKDFVFFVVGIAIAVVTLILK